MDVCSADETASLRSLWSKENLDKPSSTEDNGKNKDRLMQIVLSCKAHQHGKGAAQRQRCGWLQGPLWVLCAHSLFSLRDYKGVERHMPLSTAASGDCTGPWFPDALHIQWITQYYEFPDVLPMS